ncbi:YD repeat (Two copies) [Bacillus toyonensis]|uniref:DNRLRE domain-containing protein n=1 Tax=Bacillus toyonensis TaxID=155322 RepID=UPI0002794CF3|nr:DNRLRE domain-containing protein [Bacillus toyonensis]EJQ78680.1 YD repeat (two copies) [Bacillus toyonensis]EJV41858.1 YD repeat (two copies) [Bacillus toyonensis]EJV89963.1 YD repeat (two copies) [Bacillus toyonensis]EOP31977.1 YD repeat (two copies) [Bacillus toyonensis]EOP46745.1 YD repeat (two copies) [Bacillus toyonensis]
MKKKKTKRRWLSFLVHLMIMTLIVSLIPIQTQAETAPPFVPPVKPEQPATPSDNLSAPDPTTSKKSRHTQSLKAAQPTEIVENRTETQKVFDNGNGTFTKKMYTEPVHMKENGKWEEISSNLKATSTKKIATTKTELKSSFQQVMKNGEYATFEAQGHSIQYALKQARGEKDGLQSSTVDATYKDNTIWYKGVFPNIDLRTTNFNGMVKEDLILHQYTGHHAFVFELKTDLQPTLEQDGSIHLQDEQKKTIFTLPKPYMSDSNVNAELGEAVTSQDVAYKLEKKSSGLYELTVTADAKWLQAPERVYPVYIDPPLELVDFSSAYASSAYPNANYSGGALWDSARNEFVLNVGYFNGTTGTNEAFIKTDVSGLQNTNATIQSAKFYAYATHHYYTNSPNGVWLDEITNDWNPASLNWYSRPGSMNITSTNVGRGQWAVFDVTNTVQAWANGSKQSYGFKLHTNGNGQGFWKKFVAAENGVNAPYLEVTYTYPTPSTPRVTANANGSGSNSGYLDISWDAAPGATGYEVMIFNGYDYEYYPVGNVTNWSTKGKNIWPTPNEVAQGEFNLHDDNKGSELALDPAPVYRNAFLAGSPYGDYSSSHRYWIRVIATYPYGYGPWSEANTPYIPLEPPKQPTGSAYVNIAGNDGYTSINWNVVPGATGYKVWVYNGKEYEAFDVGNVTTWTTQNQNIWPTQTEISQGRYLLHHDKAGTELALDPSPVYRNSGGNYPTHTNYWFRVTAYSTTGYPESGISDPPFTPVFTKTSLLGMQDYWANVPVIGGQVTASNGNFVMDENDFKLDGRGPGISIDRTYNSQDNGVGMFGKGWYSSVEENIREEANGNLLLTEEDKGNILFTKIGNNQYQAPNGIDLEATKTSDGFEIKAKDQSVRFFTAEGKIKSEKDAYENEVKYEYDSITKKLKSITDASGKVFTFTYTGEYVSKITGPSVGTEPREVTFEYNGNDLIASTTPEKKKYRYGYENGKLRYTYDPKHTEAKPYKTTYTYEGEKLVKVTDPLGKETTIAYNDETREVTVTDPKGVKDIYAYTVAGNPLKTIVDADGLKLTTTFEYQANRLTKKTNPKDQGQRVSESYTYDGKGNVTSVTDTLGTEKYEYNANNDVTKVTDTEGKTTTVTYDGTNAVSATTKGNETNQAGNTSSVTKYSAKGNPVAGSSELAMATNLMRNAGFESPVNAGNLGVLQGADDGTISQDTSVSAPGALGGKASLKVVSKAKDTSWGYIIGAQDVFVDPNQTYTLSGWVKTDNLKNASAFFNIVLLDGNGNPVASPYRDNRYSKLTGTKEWTERQLTFRTTADTKRVRIYMEVEHQNDPTAGGTAWFDNMQLEEGVVSSSYNPVLNSSFEDGTTDWWGFKGNISADWNQTVDGGQSLKLVRNTASDSESSVYQTIMLNQAQAQPITVTGMSKAEGVPKSSNEAPNSGYAMVMNTFYQDGTAAVFEVPFATGTHDWQRGAVTIPATKPIKQIDIAPLLRGTMTGTVWFDAIRVIDGNKLTKQEYDSDENYVKAMYDEEDRKTSFTYDTYGNKKTETDPKDNKKSYEYNADNQLTKTTLPNSTSVAYQYDNNGNVIEKLITADSKTQKVTYEYDVDNKLTIFKDALSRQILHTYDANANRISTKMPTGSLLEWTYDAANRITEAKRNGQVAFSYEYDANGNETKVTDALSGITRGKAYDVGNRITSMTDRGGSVSWTYYDKTDKLKETKIAHGSYNNTTNYVYNALNQNTEIVDGSQTYRFDYDEFGNVRTYTAGNGAGASFQYDQTNKVKQVTVGNKQGDILLYETYQYDANGNRKGIERQTSTGKQTVSYEYDSINQLKKETLADGTINTYGYDGFGNRTSVKIGSASSITAQFNEGNQLTKFGNETLTYDANGNRTSDEKYTYTWNEADQLTSITKQGESTPFAKYKYDDDGRRIEKEVNGQVIRYFYDGDSINPLYETDANGTILRQYVYGVNGVRVAMKSQGQTLYYHYNPHGDVIAMTDASGSVVAKYEYDAWGNVLKSEATGIAAENPFGYTGYMYDKEIGMYYLMARYYHPTQGVFLSVDPDPGDEDDPITQNGYTYGDNNPVMMVDPDGHVAWWVAGAGIGAAFEVGGYLWRNRKKGYSWRGIGKAALVGGATGLYGGAIYRGLRGTRLATKMITMGSFNAKADAVKRTYRKQKVTLRSTAKAYAIGAVTGGTAIGGRLWRGKKYPIKAVRRYTKAVKKFIYSGWRKH